MSYLGKIIKGAAILGAVGALLALAAPTIAGWAGVTLAQVGISAHVGWAAAYFGAFGAINAAVDPIISAVWPKSHHSQTRAAISVVSASAGAGQSADMAPELAQSTNFQDKYASSRTADGSFADKVTASRENLERVV